MFKKLTTIATFAILTGCAAAPSSTYIPPTGEEYATSVVMPYDYNTSWSKLVRAASQTFFAIENFEKDSGLMTLSFGSENVIANIDCGTMNGQNYTSFWMSRTGNSDIDISGKMNLLVQPEGEDQTRVSVSARYIVNMSSSGQTYNYFTGGMVYFSDSLSMSFDSNSTGSDMTSNPSAGTSAVRTCAPTGNIEQTVIDAIKSA